MKKKLLGLAVLGVVGVGLAGCGNRELIDLTYTYNYAQILLPNGEIIEGNVSSWSDYDGEQLQIKLEDGNTYLVNSVNVLMSTNRPEANGSGVYD